MPRNLSDTQNQYLANNAIIGILLIELTNKNDTVEYYTDAPYDITIGATTYSATDKILQITENTETAELQISSVNIVLSALSTNAITDYATPDMINKNVTIRRAFIDSSSQLLVGDSAGDLSLILFKGTVSGYQVQNDQVPATITLEISSQFADFRRINGRRTNEANYRNLNTYYTTSSARPWDPKDDRIMEFAFEGVQDIRWGQA